MNRSLNISQVAHATLAQKGECLNWNQRYRGSVPTGGNMLLDLLLSCSKASDGNIDIIANFGYYGKTRFKHLHTGPFIDDRTYFQINIFFFSGLLSFYQYKF